MGYVLIVLILLFVVILVRNIRIVQQAKAYVVERLGAYKTTWNVGIHFKVPFIERVAKIVTLKEQVADFPPQPVITKDNVTMQIDTVVYFQITDPKLYTYGIEQPMVAIENLAATTLRNIIGDLELDQCLTSRDIINTQMRSILDEATDPWGIKVNRVELKNILPPKEIQNAMEKQMKAERERREAILKAEGEKRAAILEAEGEKESAILRADAKKQQQILEAEGEAEAGGEWLTVEDLEQRFSKVKEVLNKYNQKENRIIQKSSIANIQDTIDDEDYLKTGLQKDKRLQELWNSVPSGSGGDESETDLKLLNKLAYWSNCNEYLMRKYFEESPYYIAKDIKHKKKWKERQDYSKTTIQNAIKNTTTTAKQDNQRFNEEQEKRLSEKIHEEEKEREEIIQELNSKSVLYNIDSFFQKSEEGKFKPISTGFKNFDSIINGGLQKQSLVVIGGGSSMGKTTFTINLALNLLKQNKKIIYYSLEMSEEQIQSKIFSNIAYTTGRKSISSDRFFNLYDTNTMTEASKKQILEIIKARTEIQNLFVIHQSNLLDDIIQKVEQINKALKEKEEESPILIIDYLQYLQGKQKEDTQALIKRATAFFKNYAIENDSIVIVLTANNRESTKEKQKTMFSGGRDSSDIEYSSDYNLQINFAEWEEYKGNNREEELHSLQELKEMNPKEISFTLHKARMGQSGKVMKFSFDGITNNFSEINSETNDEEFFYNNNNLSVFNYRRKQI